MDELAKTAENSKYLPLRQAAAAAAVENKELLARLDVPTAGAAAEGAAAEGAAAAAAVGATTELPASVNPIPCVVPFELKGEWLPGIQEAEKALYEGMKEDGGFFITFANIDDVRAMKYAEPFDVYDEPNKAELMEKCDCETIRIDATEFGGR